VTHDAGRDVAARERGDVGDLSAMQDVAGREQARTGGAKPGIHRGGAARCVELGSREDRELVVGNPVGGEDDEVAFELADSAAVEVGELDRLDPPPAADGAHPSSG
jgi:hypothetical protein